MNQLLELNKRFLIESYLWTSGFLTFGFSIYLIFFYSEISIKWILITYTLTLIILPLFVLFVWIYDWFRKRKYKNRILTQEPYCELKKIGFNKKTIKSNHNSLVDYVTFAVINDCEIFFDIEIDKPKVALFTIYTINDYLGTEDFLDELHHYNIEYRWCCFTKEIKTNKEKFNSIQNLEKELIEFTHIVKKLKSKPISVTEWNDKLNPEKEGFTELKSLYLFKLFIVLILVGITLYVFQTTIVFFFGEDIYVLIIFGICIFYFIKYLVTKLSGFKNNK